MKLHLQAATLLLMTCTLASARAPSDRQEYLELAQAAFQRGLETVPAQVEEWCRDYQPSEIWGYGPPGGPVWLARLGGTLYELTGEEEYAREAARLLADQHRFKQYLPEEFRQARPEYDDGLPTVPDFFVLPFYCQAWLFIQESEEVTPEQRGRIRESIAESANFVLHFPEWGPMNRAMLRAEGLELAAQGVPDHPNAATWRRLSRALAADSWNRWEEEDAQVYHPVWVSSLIRYSDAIGDDSLFEGPVFRYYFDYFLQLLSPAGMVPEFGDARWNSNWAGFVACLERGAARYGRGDLKWGARRIAEAMLEVYVDGVGIRAGQQLADACRWADDSIAAEAPPARSREVLEDLVGKKIVFRDGWDPEATYLMLNYRDEGDFARVPRDFLRHTIPVEEEKMHHGHSDENAICLLMDGGSVLLGEAGYRDAIPSGEYGRFRADYFHNRLVWRKNKRGRVQPLFEFLRNTGAYRPVRSEKIDFFATEDVDWSRTRVTDESGGLATDRIVVYLKRDGLFIVVDVVKFLETDYYTLATLWHATDVLEQGPQHFVTAVDSIRSYEPPRNRALLIDFLQGGMRQVGSFPIVRQHQDEVAVYQTLASHHLAGEVETFVTVLVPHDRGQEVQPILSSIRLLEVDQPRRGVAIAVGEGERQHTVCIKTDLDSDLLAENARPRYTWESGRVRYGPFQTDASFLFARRSADRLAWVATGMVRVDHRDRTLFSALPYTFSLQPDDLSTVPGLPKWRYWEDEVEIE